MYLIIYFSNIFKIDNSFFTIINNTRMNRSTFHVSHYLIEEELTKETMDVVRILKYQT